MRETSKIEPSVGEIVRLRSGSPAMTVQTVYPNGSVETRWFHDGELRQGLFLNDTLTVGVNRNDRNDNQR